MFKLSNDGSTLDYSTLMGGDNNDTGSGIAVDVMGDIIVTGYTDSPNFPTTSNVFNRTMGGWYDIFVFKFDFPSIIKINSVTMLKDEKQINQAYSKLSQYTFRVNLIDTISSSDLDIKEEDSDVIQVCLGKSSPIHNPLNDHYLFESLAKNGTMSFTYIEVFNRLESIHKRVKKSKTNDIWFELTHQEFFPFKGPPLS